MITLQQLEAIERTIAGHPEGVEGAVAYVDEADLTVLTSSSQSQRLFRPIHLLCRGASVRVPIEFVFCVISQLTTRNLVLSQLI